MKIKKYVILLLIFLLAGTSAFAQTGASGSGRTAVTRYMLTVNSNVRNSQVFINAVLQKGTTPMRLTLNSGTYSVTVRAPGHRDYVANVNLNRNLTLNATLQPVTFVLTVNSNVKGATVFVNNQPRGTAPVRLNLQNGRYSLRVEAEGFYTYNQVLQLDGNTVINAAMQPMTFRLNVTSNVQGALVLIDGNEAGNAPMHIEISPGQYTLRVLAVGYYEYNQVLNLSENTNINVSLRKQTATVSFYIPNNYLNASLKDPRGLFTLYVDGRRIPSGQVGGFEVDAGQHRVKVETGGLAFEAEYMFEPGMGYSLEFGFLLLLKPAEG